jgi:hypothetical protein
LHTFNVDEGGSSGGGEGYEGEKQGHTGRHSLYTIKIVFLCHYVPEAGCPDAGSPFTGVVVTGDKLIAGDVVNGDNCSPANSLSPVSLTPVINIHSREFSKKFETAPMEYLGARGTLIHEKNRKSKILCQTPFKGLLLQRGRALFKQCKESNPYVSKYQMIRRAIK